MSFRTLRKSVWRRLQLAASGHGKLAQVRYGDLFATDGGRLEQGTQLPTSTFCRQADFGRPSFRYLMDQLGHPPVLHRKVWEFYFIAQALYERGCLAPGMRGIGFAVGREPLTALFAKHGCSILATDLAYEEALVKGWVGSEEHAAGLTDINSGDICPADVFAESVSYRVLDMNHIPEDLTGFDFCWSACAFEHLGSLAKGIAFVKRSMDTLRPGGIAVHTTEFNLSSNDETMESEVTSLFRRKDIEELATDLREAGHEVTPLDWSPADGVADRFVDLPPYGGEPHLRLRIEGYDSTSFGLIIRRGG